MPRGVVTKPRGVVSTRCRFDFSSWSLFYVDLCLYLRGPFSLTGKVDLCGPRGATIGAGGCIFWEKCTKLKKYKSKLGQNSLWPLLRGSTFILTHPPSAPGGAPACPPCFFIWSFSCNWVDLSHRRGRCGVMWTLPIISSPRSILRGPCLLFRGPFLRPWEGWVYVDFGTLTLFYVDFLM